MIRIDDREARTHPQFVEYLKNELGSDSVVIERMEFGDFGFTGNIDEEPKKILVERASVSDFLGKIASDRLAFQMTGMMQSCDIPILLIEGNITPDKSGKVSTFRSSRNGGYSYNMVSDLIHALQASGILVVTSYNTQYTGRRVLGIYRHWNKDKHDLLRPQTVVGNQRIRLGAPIDSRTKFIMGIPGVGETRALSAIKHFGSAVAVITASEESLASIEGWGKATAKKVYEFLNEEIFKDGDRN